MRSSLTSTFWCTKLHVATSMFRDFSFTVEEPALSEIRTMRNCWTSKQRSLNHTDNNPHHGVVITTLHRIEDHNDNGIIVWTYPKWSVLAVANPATIRLTVQMRNLWIKARIQGLKRFNNEPFWMTNVLIVVVIWTALDVQCINCVGYTIIIKPPDCYRSGSFFLS